MIIVDTSVWIDFLKNNFEHWDLLSAMIENREAAMLECIAGELLQGVKSDKEKNIILQYWNCLPQAPMKSFWIKAGILSSEQKFISKGIGLIDSVIMTACYDNSIKLWTLDKKIIEHINSDFLFVP